MDQIYRELSVWDWVLKNWLSEFSYIHSYRMYFHLVGVKLTNGNFGLRTVLNAIAKGSDNSKSWLLTHGWSPSCCKASCRAQIREQVSDPKIWWYGKSILGSGLWPGPYCGKKGSGPIMSNFWGPFFHFFGVKTALKSYIKWLLQFFFSFLK